MLLDEPLSGLDFGLRNEILAEIRGIVETLEITAIYVTHELNEAAAVADRIAILRAGQIHGEYMPDQLDEVARSLWDASQSGTGASPAGRKVIALDAGRFTGFKINKLNRKDSRDGKQMQG
jgi:ABC-type sugar transport system ATPase subunit